MVVGYHKHVLVLPTQFDLSEWPLESLTVEEMPGRNALELGGLEVGLTSVLDI